MAIELTNKISVLLSIVAGCMLAGAPFLGSFIPFIGLAAISFSFSFYGQQSIKPAYLLTSFPVLIFSGALGIGLTVSKVFVHGATFTMDYQIYAVIALSLLGVAYIQYRLTRAGT